jgi:hypothetical protein
MFLVSEMQFVFAHPLITILPGDNAITPELKNKLIVDKSIQAHINANHIKFSDKPTIPQIVIEKKEENQILPEYKGKTEETF